MDALQWLQNSLSELKNENYERLVSAYTEEDSDVIQDYRSLLATASNLRLYETMLTFICDSLSATSTVTRGKALKSAQEVILVHPDILDSPQFLERLEVLLMDGSASVRETVIDLVSKNINRPNVSKRFLDRIIERLMVFLIFREIL